MIVFIRGGTIPLLEEYDEAIPGLQYMAPAKTKRKTSKSASKDVESAMRKRKRGTLRSGSGKVTSKKQAVAIGLSEARKKGKKVARKKSA